ncbi:CPXCG motif-containing cysteine-rich protein [Dyella sp.]|uniref:CPXCG motif-containing cysteine-rich protein n=1 Tax=Dyella sp. TaxID=1869338 RepID=UPI002ED0FB20
MSREGIEFVSVNCPYCGESIDLAVDTSVESQRYIEDCQVCCKPMVVSVDVDEQGEPSVNVWSEDGE